MKHIVKLANGNRIISENTCESFYSPTDTGHFYTLRFVFNGLESCTVGRKKIDIFPDSFALFNVGTVYNASINHAKPVSTLSVAIKSSLVEDFNYAFNRNDDGLFGGTGSIRPLFMETLYPFSGAMWYNITGLKRHIDSGLRDEAWIDECLNRCLLDYHNIYQNEVLNRLNRLSSLNPATKKELFRRLLLAREFISSNFNNKIYLEDISTYCCLSVNHLLRTFKAAYGITPYQYLTQVRLQRAKLLLVGTSYPIKKVASNVGLKDTSAFIRLFSGQEGKTPLEYRKTTIENSLVEMNFI
ncbi:AraC family transcriptional regulator [Pedobacter sp.]|uniref:helix-turn-helix domain-containing protein n=1 Tax=Pedobacter sp. TaxID=1411316 RepID=UPI0031DD545B